MFGWETSDGGITWKSRSSADWGLFRETQSAAFDGEKYWILNDDGMIATLTPGVASANLIQNPLRGPPARTSSVAFSNAKTGWATTTDGVILKTTDGGQAWESQQPLKDDLSPNHQPWLDVIHFADQTHGCVLGGNGFIGYTQDGNTWHQAASLGTKANFYSVDCFDADHWIAVGGDGSGVIYTSATSGASWIRRSAIAPSSAAYLSADHIWVTSETGELLETTNGGSDWILHETLGHYPLRMIRFLDQNNGCAVGDGGTILMTEDGGDKWQLKSIGSDDAARTDLSAVNFLSPSVGYVGGTNSNLWKTVDRGQSWAHLYGGEGTGPTAVSIDVDESGANFTTSDGVAGDESNRSSSDLMIIPPEPMTILDQVTIGAGHRAALLEVGSVITLTSEAKTRVTCRPAHLLRRADFANSTTGIAVGDQGAIYCTKDGGNTWSVGTCPGDPSLLSVKMFSIADASAINRQGEVIATTDGGKHWQAASATSRRYPPPWYFAAVGLCLIFQFFLSTRPRGTIEAEAQTAADVFVSDKPLTGQDGEPDPLGFRVTAQAISRFLRNVNTTPPLTIAITGEWGSGKSSLMNMVKSDMEKFGIQPVWFNAWHHQKEEHLLAALLQNIKEQAIPSWFTRAGLMFRWKLVQRRSPLYAIAIVLGALLVCYTSGVLINHRHDPAKAADELAGKISSIEHFATKIVADSLTTQPTPAQPASDPPSKSDPVLSWFVGWTAPIVGLFGGLTLIYSSITKLLKTFGTDPAALLSGLSTKASIADLSAQTSFRYRFSREFKEVTDALNPERTMLILIDDLDRCKPDSALEVLEAVNFLISSGDCYVMLGMERERVERYVGQSFKEIAASFNEQPEAYARKYLEKLINIEIPVPRASGRRALKLVDQWKASGPGLMKMLWQQCRQAIVSPILWMGICVVVAYLGYSARWLDEPPPLIANQIALSPAAPGDNTATTASVPDAANPGTPSNPLRSPIETVAGVSSPLASRWVILGFVGLAAIAGLILLLTPNLTTTDTPGFRTALDIWADVITAPPTTPRAIKGFLNQVRYKAVCAQINAEANTQPPVPPPNNRPAWVLLLWQKIEGIFQKLIRQAPAYAPPLMKAGEGALVPIELINRFHASWKEIEPLRSALMKPPSGEDLSQILAQIGPVERVLFEQAVEAARRHAAVLHSDPFEAWRI